MDRPIGLDLRPSARTGFGTPGAGGLVLAGTGIAAIVAGLRRRSAPGMALAVAGGGLAYRGLTGIGLLERLVDTGSAARPRFRLSLTTHPSGSELVWSTITINREREPVFLFWRDATNLPRLGGAVAEVVPTGEGRERWRLQLPGGLGRTVELRRDEEVALERIVWRSTDADELRLQVDLRDGPRGATEVVLTASLPGGGGARGAARRMIGPLVESQLEAMLRRARQLLEAGEIATTEGQPSGRRSMPDEAAARDVAVGGPSRAAVAR